MNRDDIEELLSAYSLGVLRSACPLDCDQRRPWRIFTDAGEFVVRECFLNRSPQDLAFEHDLSAWLVTQGFPVSRPMPTRAGTTWCEREGRVFAVYTPVSGQPFCAGNEAQAGSAGTALARFHAIASAFPRGRAKRLPRGFQSPRDNARFLAEAFPERPEVQWLTASFGEFDEELLPSRLQEALLFNDFHPGNVVFDGDEFAGAFDLDCCYWGPRLLDVAFSVLGFSLTLVGRPSVPATPVFHVGCGRSFLQGYRSVHAVPIPELHLLPTALRRQVRVRALFDLRDVATHRGSWVDDEWELSKKQIDLVDANCDRIVEDAT